MEREKFKGKIEHMLKVLENVRESLQFTNIPTYVLVSYIKNETGIDITQIKK